jgi:Prokaryotic homologs of the JAB domain
MRYSITFAEDDYCSLAEHLHQSGFIEQGAYLLCSLSVTESESRLLVREVIPVRREEVISASNSHMETAPQSFMRAMKRADTRHLSFVFVHSHPYGPAGHSPQDDITEPSLFRTAYTRMSGQAIHASIVSSGIDQPQARVWHPDGSTSPVDVVRVIGNRFRYFRPSSTKNASLEIFDRQVRAFGAEIQQLLATLHIGLLATGAPARPWENN